MNGKKYRNKGGMITLKQISIQPPLHIFFNIHVLQKKIPVGGLYTYLFYVIIPPLFLYFLPFCFLTSCYILNVFYCIIYVHNIHILYMYTTSISIKLVSHEVSTAST